jgi:hypothetical protein
MKNFFISLEGEEPVKVTIHKRNYSNGRPALELFDAEDGLHYAYATVNLPDVVLGENEVLIKDYSENEGMLDFLVKNCIVYPTSRGIQSQHVWFPLCILRPENDWGSGELEPPPNKVDTATGKKMWELNGYRVWAESYKQAMDLVPLIESL